MKVITGGVTAPKGFQAVGVFAGIKKEKKDMAMIYSQGPGGERRNLHHKRG